MRFNDLKTALQPSLDQDLSKVYADFVRESGTGDLVRFLIHLRDQGLVPSEVLEALVEDGTIKPGAVEDLKRRATPPPTPERVASAPTTEPVEQDHPLPTDTPDPGPAQEASDTGASTQPSERASSERPKRRSERSTGSTSGAGLRRSGARTGPRSTDATGGTSPPRGAQTTAARDRLKRTMFDLRADTFVETETTDLLRRDYHFSGLVGEGAMGRVLKARDNDLLRYVAYKEMSEEIAANAHLASKFYGEAQITAQLDHPNIVPVYQLTQSNDGMLAYTMKLIRGETVEQYIHDVQEAYKKDKNRIPAEYSLEKRLEMFLRCCDALYYAHRRGIVHRDLKPENIMIGHYGEVYVMDWGIAKVAPGSEIATEEPVELLYSPEEDPELVIGTPQYMSPEQANGQNDILDHRSDQYAMGLILYELVSLRQAVTGKSTMKIVMRQQDGDKEPLVHAFGEKIPSALKAIIDKATSKEPASRYAHIQAMAEDIRRFMRDEPIAARPDGVVQSAGRWVRRHMAITAFAVLTAFFFLVLGVIAVGGGAIIYGVQQSEHQTRIGGLSSIVFAEASKIDGQFIKYEGLLGTMAATASEKLTLSGQSPGDTYFAEDFDGLTGRTVPGMDPSGRYGHPINLIHPVFSVPDDELKELALRQVGQLASIGGNLRAVLLRSESEQAARFTPARYRRRIGEQGTPISWAFLALETGASVLYPGKAGKTGYDPREEIWYQETKASAKREPGPRWSQPLADSHGQGYVLTVSQPVFDLSDNLLGVAGVSLTFDYVIDNLLQMPVGVRGVREILILNQLGERVISSDDKGAVPASGDSGARPLVKFDVDEVVEDVRGYKRSGVVSARRGKERVLVVFNRMENLGWYLVLVGNEAELLTSDL